MRVAIAEDSVLLREGIARLLNDAGFDVIAQCGTADELRLKVDSYPLDVAIVDIRLPPTHSDEGLVAALEIRARHPSVGVLVLSQYMEVGLAMKLLSDSAEGVGYLLKDRIGDVKEFLAAVRRSGERGQFGRELRKQVSQSRLPRSCRQHRRCHAPSPARLSPYRLPMGW